MAVRIRKGLVWFAVVGLIGLSGVGCGKSSDGTPARNEAAATKTDEQQAATAGPAEVTAEKPVTRDPKHRSFLEATRILPPPDQRPPDRTMTGKSVGKLYGEVVRLWDRIRFT